jgi:UDP-4-amino-4,6-dideoxy-N-acetyl-beta-L-altrosamine N-acetyltransferase
MDFFKNYTFVNFIELTREENLIILDWRNHDSIRKWMFNKEHIGEQEHLNFIQQLHGNLQKKYWLVNKNLDPIGVSSIIDIKNENAEWGYYIAPEYHETNLGLEFYYYTLSYLFDFIKLKSIYGYELINNKGASSLNSLFGFTKEKTTKKVNGMNFEVNYRELSSSLWSTIIKNDKKILRLLEFSINRSK